MGGDHHDEEEAGGDINCTLSGEIVLTPLSYGSIFIILMGSFFGKYETLSTLVYFIIYC